MSDDQRRQVNFVLHMFMAQIRNIRDRTEVRFRKVAPQYRQRCETCAFRAAPELDDGANFAPTAYGLMRALIRQGKSVFVCHANYPGWRDNELEDDKLVRCVGFVQVSVISRHEAYLAAFRKLNRIKAIYPAGDYSGMVAQRPTWDHLRAQAAKEERRRKRRGNVNPLGT